MKTIGSGEKIRPSPFDCAPFDSLRSLRTLRYRPD